MTKNVLLTVSGLHYEVFPGEESEEPIEVVCPANYYFKNGKHYLLYEEIVEGLPSAIKNTIKIEESGKLEMMKRGVTNTDMIFERGKINVANYQTPFGELLVGVYTQDMTIDLTDDELSVKVWYELDINQDKVADCEIIIRAQAKKQDRA